MPQLSQSVETGVDGLTRGASQVGFPSRRPPLKLIWHGNEVSQFDEHQHPRGAGGRFRENPQPGVAPPLLNALKAQAAEGDGVDLEGLGSGGPTHLPNAEQASLQGPDNGLPRVPPERVADRFTLRRRARTLRDVATAIETGAADSPAGVISTAVDAAVPIQPGMERLAHGPQGAHSRRLEALGELHKAAAAAGFTDIGPWAKATPTAELAAAVRAHAERVDVPDVIEDVRVPVMSRFPLTASARAEALATFTEWAGMGGLTVEVVDAGAPGEFEIGHVRHGGSLYVIEVKDRVTSARPK